MGILIYPNLLYSSKEGGDNLDVSTYNHVVWLSQFVENIVRPNDLQDKKVYLITEYENAQTLPK